MEESSKAITYSNLLFTSKWNATSVHVLGIHLEVLLPVHDALQLASGAGGGGCIEVNIRHAEAVHSILIHNSHLRYVVSIGINTMSK